MGANYKYYKIDIADIWQFEQSLFINGKSSEKFVRDLFPRIEDLIVTNGVPSLTTENYDKGDDEYRRTFTMHIEDFRDAFGDFKSRYRLNYFFTNDFCFYYNKHIILDNEYDDFDFWFVLKIRQYDSKLSEINNFLDFQLETNFKNNINEFVDFLKISIRQYQDKLPKKRVIETVNEWCEEKIEIPIKSKVERKIKGKFFSLRLKELASNPDYFQNNSNSFNDVYKQLKKNDFIHEDTLLTDFKRIFKDALIPDNKRIFWTGTNKDLQWFMKYLTKSSKKIEYHKDDIWVVASKCFINEDGKEFATDSLRKANGNNMERKKTLESILAKI